MGELFIWHGDQGREEAREAAPGLGFSGLRGVADLRRGWAEVLWEWSDLHPIWRGTVKFPVKSEQAYQK